LIVSRLRAIAAALLLAAGCSPGVGSVDERQRLAGELFDLTLGNATVERVFQGVSGPIAANYQNLYAGIASEIAEPGLRETFLSDAEPRMHDFVQRMFNRINQQIDLRASTREVMVPIYADLYDAEELRELLSFYRSELGRKVVQAEPAQLTRALNGLMARVLPELQRLLDEALVEEQRTLRETAGLPPPDA
jgi:hypothetical protein